MESNEPVSARLELEISVGAGRTAERKTAPSLSRLVDPLRTILGPLHVCVHGRARAHA